ncbi:MFS transporter [Calidifontibacter sp. DB0510]|uniref:MFS transporter n=1 Tax=Metallococcus carri TaxID=1656884 RepID=A0A967B0Q0_9MICO|nr:MFS transporter [Metallococcus carri]NHN56153.1 MFS transporter [Metallococcus carri]NOP38796.1 MFS transporter [Calidifontibacter sp. DB2511S]
MTDAVVTSTPISASPADPAPRLRALGLATLLTAYLMTMMDTFIVNVALPTMQTELSMTTAGLELVVAGYTIAFTLLLVLGGRLGDMIGRRRMLAVGLVGFTVSSLLCGLAIGGTDLILYRILQGVFAALLPTQVLGTIQATTTGEQRHRALSLYASVGGIALAVGQLVGGVLLHADIAGSSWRPLFFINVPLGILALVGLATVPESRSPLPAQVDVRGTVLLGLTLLALLIPMNQGRALGWPWWTWVSLLVVLPLAYAVWRVEQSVEARGRTPLLPPRLLHIPQVRRGLMLAAPFFMGFGSFMFVFAITLQNELHRSALTSAVAILPMAVAFFCGAFVTQRLVPRIGNRVLTIGGVLQAIGLTAVATPLWWQWPHVSLPTLAPGLAVAGLGQAFFFGGIYRAVLQPVPHELAGVGSGVLVTIQQGALATGVAGLATLCAAVGSRWGGANAFAVGIAFQVVAGLGIALGARSLKER